MSDSGSSLAAAPDWAVTAAPLELTVDCGGTRHRLGWSGGAVSLPDHPELDAELALVAFGGEEPACLALRRLWLEAVDDGGFLGEWVDEAHLGPARLSWLAMALERMANEGFHEFLRELPARRAERMGQFLHRFPRPWLDRAAATVSDAVAGGAGVVCEHAVGHLDAATAARVRRSFVEAVGGRVLTVGAASLVPLRLGVGPTTAASAGGALLGADRGIRLAVARTWLHDVWAAGAAVVDGHLILGRRRSDAGSTAELTAELAAVTWFDGRPQVVWQEATASGTAWRLTTSPADSRC